MLRDYLPSRGPLGLVVAGGAALSLYLLAMIISFVDPGFAGSEVGRNITLAGESYSGIPTADLTAEIAERYADFGSTPVLIDAGSGPATSDADRLGLSVDASSTAEAVKSANSPGILTRPVRWIGSFFTTRDVAVSHQIHESTMADGLLNLDLPGISESSPPSIESDINGVRVVPGKAGTGVATQPFADALLNAAKLNAAERSAVEDEQVPLEVQVELVDIEPAVSDADAEIAARDAEISTSNPLEITVGEFDEIIDVATLRSWLILEIEGTDVDWGLDHPTVEAYLADEFDEVETPGSDVAFVVEGGNLQVVPGAPAATCCVEGSSERIEQALRSRVGRVRLELITEETQRGSEWAESLGIVEEVASFTTTHACCQNRVTNIHLMADAVRGVVIEPGETFSMNQHVGQRTAEKGYLPAGGITNGVLVDQLGGGVSQFTTTLFNAAFYAGLDFGEYQAHSIYFSRYPYGVEATLSWPHPDLQIRNTSPYGVLIWPTYTDTSITVTLYSTKHVSVEQTGQTKSEQGVCTRVRTERTRTYADGREVVDHVFALYRPAEGINCSGESSVPTTTTEAPEEPDEPEATTTTAPDEPTTTTTAPDEPTTTTTTPPAPAPDPPSGDG